MTKPRTRPLAQSMEVGAARINPNGAEGVSDVCIASDVSEAPDTGEVSEESDADEVSEESDAAEASEEATMSYFQDIEQYLRYLEVRVS
uniref:Uncharacterized protein n=1 Tax=Oryza brachyantha TaxID=4533 RepID=J3LP93_ORYBR